MTVNKANSSNRDSTVRRKHPLVAVRSLSWELAIKEFPYRSKTPFGPQIEVQLTSFYDSEDAIQPTIFEPDDFGEEDKLYFLGPFPDDGYWVVSELSEYEAMEERLTCADSSLVLAALRHLERALTAREDLSYLSDIIDLAGYNPNKIDALCQALNLGPETGEAHYVQEVVVNDPDTHAPVEVALYKDQSSGGIFGVDCSYLQTLSDGDSVVEPFNGASVILIDGPFGSQTQ